jgi:O-antigen/teichoic acid export membrane protein
MKKKIFKKSFAVFITTLLILVILISTLQYVGVYVIYLGVPVLLISGFLAYLTRPKNQKETQDFFNI